MSAMRRAADGLIASSTKARLPLFERAEIHAEELALEHQLLRQALLQLVEQFAVQVQLLLPHLRVDASEFLELRLADLIQAAPVEIFEARHPAKRCLLRADAALDAIHAPFRHAELH